MIDGYSVRSGIASPPSVSHEMVSIVAFPLPNEAYDGDISKGSLPNSSAGRSQTVETSLSIS